MNTTFIDEKIAELRKLTSNFIYIANYSHLNGECYKIDNEFTHYGKDTLVLCKVEEGFYTALCIAIKEIGERKKEFWGEN